MSAVDYLSAIMIAYKLACTYRVYYVCERESEGPGNAVIVGGNCNVRLGAPEQFVWRLISRCLLPLR